MDTLKKNIEIGLFCGWKELKDCPFPGNAMYESSDGKKINDDEVFKYNKDWNDLMAVVDKLGRG